jgi:hypothetical protein
MALSNYKILQLGARIYVIVGCNLFNQRFSIQKERKKLIKSTSPALKNANKNIS